MKKKSPLKYPLLAFTIIETFSVVDHSTICYTLNCNNNYKDENKLRTLNINLNFI